MADNVTLCKHPEDRFDTSDTDIMLVQKATMSWPQGVLGPKHAAFSMHVKVIYLYIHAKCSLVTCVH